MVVGVAESSKSPSFDLDEDIEEHEEQVGVNLVAIQAPRGELANEGYLSTPPPQNNSNKGSQLSLGVDVEGQSLEERRYLAKARWVFGE